MPSAFESDLEKLQSRAFDLAEWAEEVLRRYHALVPRLDAEVVQSLYGLHDWMLVPITLWPFNIKDVLTDCLTVLEKGKGLNARHRLIIDLLPEPPGETICTAVADYELQIRKGNYENQVKTQAKYGQNELAVKHDPELRRQWASIKTAFDVKAFQDHKGVIRRTMDVERNLREPFKVNMRRREQAFRAAFDAFCLRWNLYGMRHDEPLLLKLAVNLTPYGTMIHIPAYWSFDPKRDIQWNAIAKLHRIRVRGRQGAVLAEGVAERRQQAEKLRKLDAEARRRGLKGAKKHGFLCAGLGLVVGTDSKRISRLRTEFKNRKLDNK